MAHIDLSGLKRMHKRLQSCESFNAAPLMAAWERIIEEDNRRGVLAGEDKDGAYMVDVVYRPEDKNDLINIRKNNKESRRLRNGSKAGVKRGVFSGRGPAAAGFRNNLTRAEYLRLDGPPLAPRGIFSRVITNLVTSHFADSAGRVWTTVAGWADVLSVTGRGFLKAHFEGWGHLPVRDLRGVRPQGKAKARTVAIKWMRDEIRWRKEFF